MNKNMFKMNAKQTLSFLFTSISMFSFADTGTFEFTSTTLIIGLFAGLLILVVFLVGMLGDKILKLTASKNDNVENVSLFNSFKEFFFGGDSIKKKNLNSNNYYKLDRGFDINLKGAARKEFKEYSSELYAVKPTDFLGLKPIPKMLKKEGETVLAGEPIFYDKGFEGVNFVSPVSGKIREIRRGAKRAITEVVIESDGKNEHKKHNPLNVSTSSTDNVIEFLAESGALVFFTERPFGVIPNKNHRPDSIHISCFDTAPLSPDYNEIFNRIDKDDFQAGIDALLKITDNVHLNIAPRISNQVIDHVKGANINTFLGQHPAGNVGVQIHHINPIKKGDIIWTIKPEDVATIGLLVRKGIYNPKRIVALTGAPLKKKYYIETTQGVNVANLIKENLKDENSRVISGNPLSGTQISKDGFLGFTDNQITVIEEGDDYELFGWLLPSYKRPSLSPTFTKADRYRVNTNMHGEKRAFVVTGEYREVLPMDIYPQFLFKAIIKENFEEIEGLGIYELLEEDVALCEFVCTSKQPLQQILRNGLDYIRSQS